MRINQSKAIPKWMYRDKKSRFTSYAISGYYSAFVYRGRVMVVRDITRNETLRRLLALSSEIASRMNEDIVELAS